MLMKNHTTTHRSLLHLLGRGSEDYYPVGTAIGEISSNNICVCSLFMTSRIDIFYHLI